MKATWGLVGEEQMIRKIMLIANKTPSRVGRALYRESQIESTEMKRRCPVDTTPNAPHPGLLRNGIHVEDPDYSSNNISVTIATSAQTPYDIYVHENPDAFHPIGQYKFMESVLRESGPYMASRLAKRLSLDEDVTTWTSGLVG